MALVRLVHPDLPGQPIEVTERAAGIHATSGWIPAEQEPEAPEPVAPPASEPAGEQAPEPEPETPRGRRTKKEL